MARTACISFTYVTAGDTLFDAVSNAMNWFAAPSEGNASFASDAVKWRGIAFEFCCYTWTRLAAVPPLGI